MGKQPSVLCLVPLERAGELLQPLEEHFAGDPRVTVMIERHMPHEDQPGAGPAGRRKRRAPVVVRDIIRALPAALRAEAHDLRFFQRLEPVGRTHEDTDTAQLVEQIRAGDPEAISELWWRFAERVRQRLRRQLGSASAADAAASDALGRILDELADYDPTTQPLSTWLDEVIDRYRASRPTPRPETPG